MSADAKVWDDERGWWFGLHDGPCLPDALHMVQGSYHLTEVLEEIEKCMGGRLTWRIRLYPQHDPGLVGYDY